jgi:ELWxxDGT repeat protein
MIREFKPGSAHGLGTPQFASFGSRAVFAAETPESGREPWLSDGIPEGTRLLADIEPGAGASTPFRFVESGGKLFFSAQTSKNGRELWVSDGTAEGTHLVADIAPGLDSGDPYAFLPFNGGLLFTPHDPVLGEELWFTDGTPEGTRLVFEFVPGPEGGEPYNPVLLDGRAWFSALMPGAGRVLWQSDGTAEGTQPAFEKLQGEPAPIPEVADWIAFQGAIFLSSITLEHGAELWRTDPATGESCLLRDIQPGPIGSNPRSLFEFEGQLYFVADDGIHGTELWRTDGTEGGTTLAWDAHLGSASGAPHSFAVNPPDGFAFIASDSAQTTVHYYRAASRDFGKIGPPAGHGAPWNVVNLRHTPGQGYEFSVQTASGETTLWRTEGWNARRLPGLGQTQGK